jgi:hypothetical protein
MKLVLVAVSALTVACASTAPEASAPEPVAAAQAQTATPGLSIYEGTYSLQGPNGVLDMRVWLDAEGKLNGELVGRGQQTTFRPTDTPHKFMHADRDDVTFTFTIENGRATMATMRQGTREVSGPRSK